MKKQPILKIRDRAFRFLSKTYGSDFKNFSISNLEEDETFPTSFRFDFSIKGMGFQDPALEYIEKLFRDNFFVTNIVVVRSLAHFAVDICLDPVKTYKTETRYSARPLKF